MPRRGHEALRACGLRNPHLAEHTQNQLLGRDFSHHWPLRAASQLPVQLLGSLQARALPEAPRGGWRSWYDDFALTVDGQCASHGGGGLGGRGARGDGSSASKHGVFSPLSGGIGAARAARDRKPRKTSSLGTTRSASSNRRPAIGARASPASGHRERPATPAAAKQRPPLERSLPCGSRFSSRRASRVSAHSPQRPLPNAPNACR